jgi:predicted RecB family nuclease
MFFRNPALSSSDEAPCRLVDMAITTDLVEAFLKCPTKCFLRARAEIETGNAYADWFRTESDVFRREGIKRLVAGVAPHKCATGAAATESGGLSQWQLALDFVARSENLRCSCHAVERIPSVGRGRAAQFVPIRFAFTNKLTRHDKLLLAFDALVISRVFGREVTLGRIIYGDDRVTLNVKVSALKNEVEKLTEKIGVLISSPSPPDLVLNRHCAECEFQTRCRQKAIDKDDLSLLGSITEKERTDFNNKGLFTVNQLAFTFRPRRRPKELKDKRERHHHALKALAIREKKLHIVGSPEIKIEGTPVFLDVEGLPDRGFYYLVGIRTKAGHSAVQHSFGLTALRMKPAFGGSSCPN